MKRGPVKIQLSQGYCTLVDAEDYARVREHKWCAAKSRPRTDGTIRVYAARNAVNPKGVKALLLLHRFIMNPADGFDVDHADGNPLNNTRINLRICTRSENLGNAIPRVGGTSAYKGVCRDPQKNKWASSIRVRGVYIFLGRFDEELEAALAYDTAARRYFKEFARPNFPENVPPKGLQSLSPAETTASSAV